MEAISFGTTHWRQSSSSLTSNQVAAGSLLCHTQRSYQTVRLSVDKRIAKANSMSYFHIRALRHFQTGLDLDSSKFTISTVVCSRLNNANSCLSRVFSNNIRRLQRVQNCLAHIVTPTSWTITSHSLLASRHWLPICQRATFKLASLVYCAVHGTSPNYLSSYLHAYALIRPFWPSSINLLVIWTSLQSTHFLRESDLPVLGSSTSSQFRSNSFFQIQTKNSPL